MKEVARLFCEPFLIYRVSVPGVHVLHDVGDLPLVVSSPVTAGQLPRR